MPAGTLSTCAAVAAHVGRQQDTARPRAETLQRPLLRWYDGARRDLPWRQVRDPYAIWVSEVMLQQTRVETVVPYFLRWMERFPTVAALATAPEDDVMRLWSGLGYYSRARNLKRAAEAIMSAYGGRFPRTRSALADLPGIGEYTSGAIASIAFDEAVPAVDGNVLRVLARLFGLTDDITTTGGRRRFRDLAATLVPAHRPGDWNQALMELGATICLPRAPRCTACPVAGSCVAHDDGTVDALPVRTPKRAPRLEAMHFAWVRHDDHVLLVRGATGDLLGGLWGLPGGPVAEPLDRLVAAQTGHAVRTHDRLGGAEHRFTHRVWDMAVWRAELHGDARLGDGTEDEDVRWVPLARLHEEAISTAHRKAIAAVQEPWHEDPPTTPAPS